LLGIENAYNLGCGHLIVFGDSELVVNLVRKIYSPRNKLLKRYTQFIWMLISNLLLFNITHVKREQNSMDKEDESKRKFGDIISLNIGTSESTKIIKLGAQCSDEEKEIFT
jgi:hypothetical protein